MGVQGFLTKVLPTVGTPLSLDSLKVLNITLDKRNKENTSTPFGGFGSMSRSSRRVRVALDISTWIAKACHGHGTDLINEQSLTNYGRAQLDLKYQREKKRRKLNCELDSSNGKECDMNYNRIDPGQKERYVHNCAGFVMSKINQLQEIFDVLIVFDGQTPPLKYNQCKNRERRRKEATEIRDKSYHSYENNEDDSDDDNVKNIMKKISAAKRAGASDSATYSSVVQVLISLLRHHNVKFIVSPYEADGQLVYLLNKKIVDLIITEDSDLIAYGSSSVLFKLDNACKKGVLFERKNIGSCIDIDLLNFSDQMLATMFVVAGCDYCESLPGVGIIRARNIVSKCFQNAYKYYKIKGSKTRSSSSDSPLLSVFQHLFQLKGGKKLTDDEKADYEERFMGALLMYRHPIVYCPISKKCLFMNDPTKNLDPDLMAYPPYAQICLNKQKVSNILGNIFDQNKTKLVIEGWMNPKLDILYDEKNIPKSIIKTFNHYCAYKDATFESQTIDSQPDLSSKLVVFKSIEEQFSKYDFDNHLSKHTTTNIKTVKLPNQESKAHIIIQPLNSPSTEQDSSASSKIQTQESSTQESSELLSSPDFFENKLSPKRNKYNSVELPVRKL